MKVSRIVILGVAMVAGVAAFVLVWGNQSSNEPVQIVQPTQEETTRVLVSTRDIQRGERLAVEDTSWIDWPKRGLQPTFITNDTPEAREELSNAVARSLIVLGEPIVDAKIVKAGSSGLMAAILTPGMRAVTLRISPETGSGGFILPGDHIDLLHTTGGSTKVVFEDVRVLAVNKQYSENVEGASIEGNNLTLELSPEDARTFLSRRSNGAFTAVLRPLFQPEEAIVEKRRSPDVTVIRYGRS